MKGKQLFVQVGNDLKLFLNADVVDVLSTNPLGLDKTAKPAFIVLPYRRELTIEISNAVAFFEPSEKIY